MESKHNLFALLYFIVLDLGGLADVKAHLWHGLVVINLIGLLLPEGAPSLWSYKTGKNTNTMVILPERGLKRGCFHQKHWSSTLNLLFLSLPICEMSSLFLKIITTRT